MKIEELCSFVEQHAPKCRVLVVGDVMLDKYYYGEVNRISPEAPVPITHVISQKETLGGAANVAHNLVQLGCQTMMAGYIGDDYHGESLEAKLLARGIDFRGLVHTDQPTTTKLRVIGDHQQMLRLDFEEAAPPDAPFEARLLAYIRQTLSESLDALILSDYGKGALTERVCQRIIRAAHEHGVPVLVDPKGTNWTKYAHADYLTPNLKEINAILSEPVKNRDDEVERAGHYAMQKYKLQNVVVTRSEAGLSLVQEAQTLHIPTRAQEVFDVSGAGDTVIAVFAMGLSGGLSARTAVALANFAAGIVVAKLGTYAVSTQELVTALKRWERESEESVEVAECGKGGAS